MSSAFNTPRLRGKGALKINACFKNRLTVLLSDHQDWVLKVQQMVLSRKLTLSVRWEFGVKLSLIFAFSSALPFIPLMKPPIIPAAGFCTHEVSCEAKMYELPLNLQEDMNRYLLSSLISTNIFSTRKIS